MIFKALILLLGVQFILFLIGCIYCEKITKYNKILGKTFRYLYIADSFIMIIFVIIFAVYIYNHNGIFLERIGKMGSYMIIISLFLSNLSKIIAESTKIFSKNLKLDNVGIVLYIVGTLCAVACLFSYMVVKVSYIPDENRKIVAEYKFTNIEISSSKVDGLEDYYMIMVDKNNTKNALLIDTQRVSSKYSKQRNIEKYEVTEIKEDCFGNKKEKVYFEYIIYTPDETEKKLISLYSKFL